MFGEELMFGQTELKIDDKGRIFIPAYTKREPGEKLALIYNSYSAAYEIYRLEIIDEIRAEILKKLENAKTKEELQHYSKMLANFVDLIKRNRTVDSQGRFSTGDVFKGYSSLLCTGAGYHLMLKPMKKK